ncbi:acyl-CoA N-acyltransferase [Pseudomassariella vexata]|uniref:Acyl-CoA N-acyltransferase n=1 Tax=Pseudomassariella vexata TaxID=1141098 RepID=A0A1Y2DSL0_9PEZI|nr:acyl-CoA N-acyltransferase [Pseudomassariella vexata]ORY61655.1 acyl-CoA N-acyltransferase [Pseudomassariella vexata]
MSTTQTQPLGPPINATPAQPPTHRILEGTYVSLVPLNITHAPALYTQLNNPSIFTYMTSGPFTTLSDFTIHISTLATSNDPLFFTIIPKIPLSLSNSHSNGSKDGKTLPADTPSGYLSYLRITPPHRSIEIGNITLSPILQRTTAATESLYLVMHHAMSDLGYRRLEWKCDDLNAKSRRAAERLGFVYEGTFRKHLIIKGRSRDTWWGSITDEEWEEREGKVLRTWLEERNFVEGRQVRRVEEIRRALEG